MTEPLGILARREIEANIIAPIYAILKRDLGEDRAKAVIAEAITQDAIKSGADMAAAEPNGANIESFVAIQHLWTKDDALVTDVTRADASAFHYTVKRCRYAEMYRDKGLAEIGALLSCVRDAAFIQGYDPRVKLTRTQTIMQGASCCDFRYDVDPAPISLDQ